MTRDRPRAGRFVDLMLFVAEHDDLHLASITELARERGRAAG
jgi:hypothetical protein